MVLYDRGTDRDILIRRELGYAERLENAGPKTLIVPIGDPRYGALSGNTLTTKGAQQVTGTLNGGNWDAMDTPLRSTALIPIWTPNGTDDWIEFADADFWTDTADGTAGNEPSLTIAIWVRTVFGSAIQLLWGKASGVGAGGTDWTVYMDANERPSAVAVDDSANALIGRRDGSQLSEAWHYLVFTKSTGTTTAAWKVFLDAVQVDDGNLSSGSYTAMENGSSVVRIGAESDGGNPLISPLAGAFCGPLFDPGQVWSANKITEDYRLTRAALANVLGL